MQTSFINADQPPKKENPRDRTKRSTIGFVSRVALLGALTGCVGHVDGPRHGYVYAQAPSVHVDGIVAHDDYVYYPGYEVYYSSNRRQYTYRDGRSWVSRPAPPRVSVDVLFASPSVTVDFHDSPSIHHARVVQQYPKHWAPPGSKPGQGNRDKGKGNDRKENDRRGRK